MSVEFNRLEIVRREGRLGFLNPETDHFSTEPIEAYFLGEDTFELVREHDPIALIKGVSEGGHGACYHISWRFDTGKHGTWSALRLTNPVHKFLEGDVIRRKE